MNPFDTITTKEQELIGTVAKMITKTSLFNMYTDMHEPHVDIVAGSASVHLWPTALRKADGKPKTAVYKASNKACSMIMSKIAGCCLVFQVNEATVTFKALDYHTKQTVDIGDKYVVDPDFTELGRKAASLASILDQIYRSDGCNCNYNATFVSHDKDGNVANTSYTVGLFTSHLGIGGYKSNVLRYAAQLIHNTCDIATDVPFIPDTVTLYNLITGDKFTAKF